MTNYVLSINEQLITGKVLLNYLKSLSKTSDYVNIIRQRPSKINGLQEAIEDIKMGRVTTCKNYEEYIKSINES
jgi:hypothetical protein